MDIKDVVKLFAAENKKSIDYGCIRGNCGIPALDFMYFADMYGLTVYKIDGYFKVDNPSYDFWDFTEEEHTEIKQMDLDPNNRNDRERYAKLKNIVEEIQAVPHQWNVYQDHIIDFTANAQFIKTGMAADMKKNRYTEEERIKLH